MRALLLASGRGSRLGKITEHTPKCLVPIGGKPLLFYWMENLRRCGCSEVFVNIHYLGCKVKEYISSNTFPFTVHLLEEEELLGTGGTLKKFASHFKKDRLLLAHADNLCLADLTEFIATHDHRPPETELTMMLFRTRNPESCGVVELDKNKCVTAFYEKVAVPPTNLANGAVFIIEPSVLSYVRSMRSNFIDFSKEVLPHFVGKMFTWQNTVYHRDIGTPTDYQLALNEWPKLERRWLNYARD